MGQFDGCDIIETVSAKKCNPVRTGEEILKNSKSVSVLQI